MGQPGRLEKSEVENSVMVGQTWRQAPPGASWSSRTTKFTPALRR